MLPNYLTHPAARIISAAVGSNLQASLIRSDRICGGFEFAVTPELKRWLVCLRARRTGNKAELLSNQFNYISATDELQKKVV